jgi:O-acetyl-ADP-ribose deacetylase (regulator of RNase III)
MNKMKILEIKGDLFSSKDSLAHCVSTDLQMSKGIATLFKNKFSHVQELQAQNKKTGQVAYIKDLSDRYIFYLITKNKYFERPTYISLYESLVELRELCKQLKVSELSIPRIGCGLDRLEWTRVKKYLEGVFKDTDITITVYYLK